MAVLAGALPWSSARTFTHRDGRTVEADFVSATEQEVVIRLAQNKRLSRIPIERLSEKDATYIHTKRKEALAVRKLLDFLLKAKGRKIGNGECWTLANKAFKSAGTRRPGADIRVWGRSVDWKKEEVKPGDLLELRSARFSSGVASGPNHTAVVIKKGRRRGLLVVHYQNWGAAGRKVPQATFDLASLEEGEAAICRYEAPEELVGK
jgi:hypothetical protein